MKLEKTAQTIANNPSVGIGRIGTEVFGRVRKSATTSLHFVVWRKKVQVESLLAFHLRGKEALAAKRTFVTPHDNGVGGVFCPWDLKKSLPLYGVQLRKFNLQTAS